MRNSEWKVITQDREMWQGDGMSMNSEWRSRSPASREGGKGREIAALPRGEGRSLFWHEPLFALAGSLLGRGDGTFQFFFHIGSSFATEHHPDFSG